MRRKTQTTPSKRSSSRKPKPSTTLHTLIKERNYDRLMKFLDDISNSDLIWLNKACHGAIYNRLRNHYGYEEDSRG